jgi:thiamine-monophosphate kinase
MGEFDLIERFFWRADGQGPRRAALGNGDDCALLAPASGMQLAVSTDTLVEGRHFLSTVDPARLGHKALAVNLSDLAACGAAPMAFTLALTLPRVDEAWLSGFAQGLLALADAHGCELVGGDTTAGPLAITITAMGEVPAGQALLRSGAKVGDDIWVSGWPGEAWLALQVFRGQAPEGVSAEVFAQVRQRMECPTPRVALGQALLGVATSAIDISDGLLGDLHHILRRSGMAAVLDTAALPCSPCLARLPRPTQLDAILAGGDDYELLFTAPATQRDHVAHLSTTLGLPLTCIGYAHETEAGVPRVALQEGEQCLPNRWTSFDHFKA